MTSDEVYGLRQCVFDKVARALRAQGGPSFTTERITSDACGVYDGGCMYRGPDGRKCAAGHLIPDERYSPDMEGRRASQLGDVFEHGLSGSAFLDQLQRCHDEACDDDATTGAPLDAEWLRRWEARMRDLAGIYGLSSAALDA